MTVWMPDISLECVVPSDALFISFFCCDIETDGNAHRQRWIDVLAGHHITMSLFHYEA
jgi:hypothetical protein